MEDLLTIAQEVTDIITKQVKEIDLILIYGGAAQGRGTKYSDIDMIAISENKKVVWEFVIEDRPICLWSISWEKLEEHIDNFNYWSVGAGAFTNAKVLYSKSKKILERFEKITEKIAKEGGKKSLIKAINNFDAIYGYLWHLQKAINHKQELEYRFLIWAIANSIVNVLSPLNNQPLLNNWGKQLHELVNFERLPNDFINRFTNLVTAEPEDVLEIASNLVDDVNLLCKEWLSEKNKINDHTVEGIATEWASFIEYKNKVKSATESNDLVAGLYAATDNAEEYLWAYTILQGKPWSRTCFYSTEEAINYLSKNNPENIATLLKSKNLIELQEATEQLSQSLAEELQLRGLKLPIATSLEEGLQFLQILEF
ncbi:MAG: nucleotidyltransferase domain-containing protein [Candidatus Heimdallarchaeota archaeon]|nr:nucleotidyltransferase domain-containing protein [Candidatus Heimdallarchaeota archaeon]